MPRIANECEKVQGWKVPGKNSWDMARMVLQSLLDDRLVVVKKNFELTTKGREYLEDPQKWKIDGRTTADLEQKLIWESIYQVFDKAYRRLKSRVKTAPVRET